MNSTVSVLKLWHYCIDSQEHPADRLHGGTLRRALEGLGDRIQSLECSSVDEILWRHFGCGRGSHVSFTRYWRGMETILHACNSFNSHGVDAGIDAKVASLRAFRDSVLDELPVQSRLDASGHNGARVEIYQVVDLKLLYQRLRYSVPDYWEDRLASLSEDDQTVTGDEIAVALLSWLEELLQDFLSDHGAPDDGGGWSQEGSTTDDEEAAEHQQSSMAALGSSRQHSPHHGTGGTGGSPRSALAAKRHHSPHAANGSTGGTSRSSPRPFPAAAAPGNGAAQQPGAFAGSIDLQSGCLGNRPLLPPPPQRRPSPVDGGCLAAAAFSAGSCSVVGPQYAGGALAAAAPGSAGPAFCGYPPSNPPGHPRGALWPGMSGGDGSTSSALACSGSRALVDGSDPMSFLRCGEENDSAEVAHFRKQLLQSLADAVAASALAANGGAVGTSSNSASEASFMDLYRATRDALDEEVLSGRGAGGNLTPQVHRVPLSILRATSVRSGVEVLDGFVRRVVRGSFRHLESVPHRRSGLASFAASRGGSNIAPSFTSGSKTSGGGGLNGSGPSSAAPALCRQPRSGQDDLIASLVKSQARSAIVLERRAQTLPIAFRIAWLLERARRRYLCGVLSQWRAG